MLPYARGLRLRTRCAMSSTSGSPFLVITIGLPASATSSISAKYLAFNSEALMMRDMRAKTFMPSHDHGLEARRHPCPAPTRSWLRPPGLHQAGDLRSELVRVAARLIQRSHYFYLHVSPLAKTASLRFDYNAHGEVSCLRSSVEVVAF